MSLPTCTVSTNNIQNLPDAPNLSPDELKQKFDKTGKELKDYLNSLILEIEKADEETKKAIQSQMLKTYKYDVVTNSVISESEDYTVPEIYKVNTSGLDIYFEGELLILNKNYQERGTGNSNKIRFNFEVPKDSNLIFVIRK